MIGRDQAREAARRELAKRLYQRDRPGLVERVLRAIGRWLTDRWDDLLHSVGGGSMAGLIGLAVVVVVGAVLLGSRLGPLRRGTKAGDLDAEPGRDADSLRAQAGREAAAGDWAAAVRTRLRAVVRALEERDLLEPRPGRTATEVAAEASRPLPAAAGALRDAAEAFGAVWYGGQRATEADYRRVVAADDLAARTRPVTEQADPEPAVAYMVPS